MSTSQTAFSRRVVVGVDGSDGSKNALRWAAWMAGLARANLELVAAWGLSTRYGWTEVPNRWDPASDTEKLLNMTIDEVFGTERPPSMELTVGEGGAAGVLLDRAVGALMRSSAAAATVDSPVYSLGL
jgi:nucleotide-binding universal stress UspA family protein